MFFGIWFINQCYISGIIIVVGACLPLMNPLDRCTTTFHTFFNLYMDRSINQFKIVNNFEICVMSNVCMHGPGTRYAHARRQKKAAARSRHEQEARAEGEGGLG